MIRPMSFLRFSRRARVRSAAAQGLREAKLGPLQMRFDVASVLFDTPEGRLNYLIGAF